MELARSGRSREATSPPLDHCFPRKHASLSLIVPELYGSFLKQLGAIRCKHGAVVSLVFYGVAARYGAIDLLAVRFTDKLIDGCLDMDVDGRWMSFKCLFGANVLFKCLGCVKCYVGSSGSTPQCRALTHRRVL